MTDDYWPTYEPDPDPPDAREVEALRKELLEKSQKNSDDVFSNAIFAFAINQDRADPDSPLSYLLMRARQDAVRALKELMYVSLYDEAGIADARFLQNEAKRYFALTEWLDESGVESEKMKKD